MLVVAIIGLLAAIALPRFADLVIKAKEAAVKGKLGTFRSALTIYYADNEGQYPWNLDNNEVTQTLTTGGKYLDAPLKISVPTVLARLEDSNVGYGLTSLDWFYIAGPRAAYIYSQLSGQIVVNCVHTDTSGRRWSTW